MMPLNVTVIKNEMFTEAKKVAVAAYEKAGGDYLACGFAWVTIYPKNKSNTKEGREERRVIESLGFKKDWTGKAYQVWNPSGLSVQSVDIKEKGAVAAANVLRKYGFNAYADSRLD